MEARISIITLGVKDLDRSFRFYHEGLGLPTQGKAEDGIISSRPLAPVWRYTPWIS